MDAPLTYYIGLGSNIGDKPLNLRSAVDYIGRRIGQVSRLSSFIETAPWGFRSPNTFLNAALAVESPLEPHDVLRLTQEIEREMGRTTKSQAGIYADRVIDIDLLLCYRADGRPVCIDSPALRLPHPLIAQREFVRVPLREIGIEWPAPE